MNKEQERQRKLLRLREERMRQMQNRDNNQNGQIGRKSQKNRGPERNDRRGNSAASTNNQHNGNQNRGNNGQEPAKSKAAEDRARLAVSTRHGEVVHAQRLKFQDVNQQATQHIIGIPVNKSRYNGNQGRQITDIDLKKMRPDPNAVRIVPLGGLGEIGIGKNMTMIEYKDEIILIDMGTLFATPDYPGINYMIPNIQYLEQNLSKVKAICFTHAHLDHIGAVRHLLPRFATTLPVYATEFTLNMIKKQMDELAEPPDMNYIAVDPHRHEQIQISPNLSIEFVHVLHSVPGSAAFIIRTPCGNIVYMGDWRFENNPVLPKFDMERLTEVAAKEHVDLLINESTNIDSPGRHPHSEFTVGENFGRVMDNHGHGRIIISCFSSQIMRMQLALDEAAKRGRKVAFAGFSMITNLEVALKSRQIKVPKDVVMKMEDIVKLPDDKVTIICTGSQGELNAVLNRMVTGAHKYIKIKATDCIVFSSNPIPGNEPHVTSTVDGLLREGAQVIQNGKNHIHNLGPLHLSGHAYYDDHVELVQTLKPTNYLPNHGEFYMLEHNAEMAENVCGIPRDRILVADNGDIVELTPNKTIRKAGRVRVGSDLYDDEGAQVNEAVVKDRIHISTEGIFMVVLTISRKTGRLLKIPDIISRAFIYIDESEELIGKVRFYLRNKTDYSVRDEKSLKNLKESLKDDIAHILYDATGHTPVIIPVLNLI
jgi:ribonuclease J